MTSLVAAMVSFVSVASAPVASAANALACDQNTLYAITTAGQFDSINVTTGAATPLVPLGPAGNALGVSPGGTDAWAFDGAGQDIVHYTASTGATNGIADVDSNAPSAIIRGAVNPATGVYYYAGNGASAYLGAYNTLTNTKIGRIGAITGLQDLNGDFAFSSQGLLFVVSGDEVRRVNETMSGRHAGAGRLDGLRRDYLVTTADAKAGTLVNTASVSASGVSGQLVEKQTNSVLTTVAPVTATVAPVTPAPPVSGSLSYTGIPGPEALVVALLLLVTGLGLVIIARKRRHS